MIEKYNSVIFLIDLPGQIEIFTHHSFIRKLIMRIEKKKIKLISVIISDSLYWKDNSIVYSILIVCLTILLNLEITHVNLLSKSDLISTKGFNVEIFSKFSGTFYSLNFSPLSIFCWANKLNSALNEFIFDFSSFYILSVNLFNIEHLQKIYLYISKILKKQ